MKLRNEITKELLALLKKHSLQPEKLDLDTRTFYSVGNGIGENVIIGKLEFIVPLNKVIE